MQLKHLTLRNRIMSTSHACGLEEHDAMPGEAYQAYHEAKARGGLALTMFGDAASSRNLAAAMYDSLRLCSTI